MDVKTGLKILDTTQGIINHCVELTGKPFKFEHNPNLVGDCSVRIARSDDICHIITYKKKDNIDHLIIHECMHIVRFWGVPVEDRKVPVIEEKHIRLAMTQMWNDVLRMSKNIPEDTLTEMVRMYFNGIVIQLVNYPADIRIEKWIYENCPDIRNSQRSSISKLMTTYKRLLSNKGKEITPKIIYESGNLMNYAFGHSMELIGIDKGCVSSRPYIGKVDINLGNKFVDMILKVDDLGLKQDCETTDKWAKDLGLDGWYSWGSFELSKR